jgi:putative ABC transport system permease protein
MSKFVPNFIFKYTFLDEEFNSQYQNEERIRRILEYFTFLAVFVSCLGLLGLASFSAERRTKEIGVRKVLGASVSGIIFMLTKDIIQWILLANVVAWPVAYFSMHRWLQSFAYRTNLEIWMFLLSAILTLVIALLTVSYQSAKAARLNPVESLRCE